MGSRLLISSSSAENSSSLQPEKERWDVSNEDECGDLYVLISALFPKSRDGA